MVEQIQAVVIKDSLGFYPGGCTKTIPCGLHFLRSMWLASADEYDEDCPTLLVARGQEVEAGHAAAIHVQQLKGDGSYYYVSTTLDDYLSGCNCCVGA